MSLDAKSLSFNARQVNSLLEQAELGYHPLFEIDLIRRALRTSPVADRDETEVLEELHDVIIALTELETIDSQRLFIEQLPEQVQNIVVHLYFRFLDQFIQRRSVTLH